MNTAAQKRPTLNLRSDKLRLHGWTMGLILLAASLLVASSVTAVINFILIAIPVLTLIAVAAMFIMGIPMVAVGIEAGSRAKAKAKASNDSPVLLSLDGFWKHPQAWQKGQQPHFLAFQPLDHSIIIHLDSESDNHSMTMGEFMRMTSGTSQYQGRSLENTLEGVTSWRS